MTQMRSILVRREVYCWDGSSLKWTVLGESGRSRGVKLDGTKDWNWMVMNQTGRPKRLKVDGPRKCTVLESKRGRSKGKRLYDLNKWIWTVSRDELGRSKGMKLNGIKKCKWTVQRDQTGRFKGRKLDGLKKSNLQVWLRVTYRLGLG